MYSGCFTYIEFANSGKRIYIWDENFRDYYDDLFNKIGVYAKFNLLGEMHVLPQKEEKISLPAFKIDINNVETFLFFIDPHDLLKIAYVARRGASYRNLNFYQRTIKVSRLKQIAKYIDNSNFLPNDIIIAFDKNMSKYVEFMGSNTTNFMNNNMINASQLTSYGILRFPKNYMSCWVIDGQHRLYAFSQTDKILYIPVIAFKDLDINQQSKIFLDINKNQKPVPPDLVWDLNGDLIPNEPDGIISRIVKILNDRKDSPLNNLIIIPSKRSNGSLKISGLCLTIKRMSIINEKFGREISNPFYSENPEKMLINVSNALIDYLNTVKEVFNYDKQEKAKNFILDNGGINIILRFMLVFLSALCYKNGYEEEIIKRGYIKYLDALKTALLPYLNNEIKMKNLKASLSSEGGRKNVLNYLAYKIKDLLSDPLILPEEDIKIQKINQVESLLKEILNIGMLRKYPNGWFNSEVLGKETYNHANKNSENKKSKLPYYGLTLGETIKIIKENGDIFYDNYFIRDGAFESKEQLEYAFTVISKSRVDLVHPDPTIHTNSGEDDFQKYSERIIEAIRPFIKLDENGPDNDNNEIS